MITPETRDMDARIADALATLTTSGDTRLKRETCRRLAHLSRHVVRVADELVALRHAEAHGYPELRRWAEERLEAALDAMLGEPDA